MKREEDPEAERDQEQLRDERDDRDDDRDPVEAGAADEPKQGDRQDDEDGADDVPRVAGETLPADRVAEVVRREQSRERDHDRVVEKQHPAVRKPTGSLKARRASIAAPRVGIAAVPSA